MNIIYSLNIVIHNFHQIHQVFLLKYLLHLVNTCLARKSVGRKTDTETIADEKGGSSEQVFTETSGSASEYSHQTYRATVRLRISGKGDDASQQPGFLIQVAEQAHKK